MKTDFLPLHHRDRELTEREKDILRAIIQMYILSAEPVGSRFLSKYLEEHYKLSPATIRNIMGDLEDMGFIGHPHTSAGRIPTDRGYRMYVDSLMKTEGITNQIASFVQSNLHSASRESVLRDASKVLSSLSHYLGIVVLPNLSDVILKRLRLIALSSTRLLVVVELESDIVRTVTLESNFQLDYEALDEISRLLNEKITGRPISFLRDNFSTIIRDRIPEEDNAYLRLFVNSVETLFSDYNAPEDVVHIAGTQNLLEYPEFETKERVKGVIELIENEDLIVHILDRQEINETGTYVMIGSEMGTEMLNEYSVIVSHYKFGDAKGSLGIIGPRRMNYSKLIPLLTHVAQTLSDR